MALFLKSKPNFKHLERKDYLFHKLQTTKNLVRPMCKKRYFRTPLDSQHVRESQTLVRSTWQQLCHIFSLVWEKLSWKMSLLLILEILGLFINTFTAYDKYFHYNGENFLQPIQIQLSKKQKTFSWFFAPFLEYVLAYVFWKAYV